MTSKWSKIYCQGIDHAMNYLPNMYIWTVHCVESYKNIAIQVQGMFF